MNLDGRSCRNTVFARNYVYRTWFVVFCYVSCLVAVSYTHNFQSCDNFWNVYTVGYMARKDMRTLLWYHGYMAYGRMEYVEYDDNELWIVRHESRWYILQKYSMCHELCIQNMLCCVMSARAVMICWSMVTYQVQCGGIIPCHRMKIYVCFKIFCHILYYIYILSLAS